MIDSTTTPTLTRAARRPVGEVFRSTTALAMLVMIGATGAASAQQWTGVVDTDYGTAGNWNPAAVPVAGDDVTIDAGIDVDVNAAFAADSLLQSSGTMTVGAAGDIDFVTGSGAVEFRHAAALQIDAGGQMDANQFTVSNAATVSIDGTLAAPTHVKGTGSLGVNAGGTLNGDLLMTGTAPMVTIANGGTLTGTATVNRGTLTNDGAIGGGIDTTGGDATVDVQIGATGTVAGAVTHGAGTLTNGGALNGGLSVGNGATATVTAGGSVTGGTTVSLGTLNLNSGSTTDGVTLNGGQNGGEVNASGTINGPVTVNGGEFNTDGTINGNVVTNGGQMNAEGTIVGDIDINSGSGFFTTGALTHTGNLDNDGGLHIEGGSMTTSGTFNNTGQLFLSNGRQITFGGAMTNTGTIGLGGGVPGATTVTVGGSVIGGVGSTFDLQNGAAGDGITIKGNLTTAGANANTVQVDADLRVTNAGTADVVTVNGTLDGAVVIDVDSILTGGVYTLQETPITIMDANAFGGTMSYQLTGDLPTNTGLVLYSLIDDPAAADIQLFSELNPALGGVAGTIASVEGLLSTTGNRPSGAYVSGIAYDAPGNCSTGSWARVSGGRIDADTVTNNGTTASKSLGRVEYAGIQGGLDFGCFEAFDGGWDISGGLLIGMNTGNTGQQATVGTPAVTTITASDFDQYFFGGYVAATSGNWSGELQLRQANTDYTFSNIALDMRDADVDSESTSLSGSMTYRIDMQNGLALLPSVGFNLTRSSTGALFFEDAGGTTLGRLDLSDHTYKTGFVGATLSNTTVNEAAMSATNAFATATYHVDFSGDRASRFTSFDGVTSAKLTTGEVGDFAELSAGFNHVQVLSNTPGQIRQVNYGFRADYRFGGDVQGMGLTGQMRLQF
ncbi:hypothetical protein [Rhodovulum adriaticum]|uniref:Autotransporter domain-containing protein n=1 Tax=Rhodovulum adriaticum TaxID=35804 RepID=A0A4R2P038_RHOAD|nr:hypothetical protein [Rhodovulum adriaticum]MBK1634205.1 hypothetical protein [Rhodovulum adriaticum]TCP27244.1 hypothetical protein EV656_101147 [Rhodovulum adriaticum]